MEFFLAIENENLKIVIEILDYVIVLGLIYLLYRLLKGGIGFSLVIGLAIFWAIYLVVDYLEMRLLGTLLGGFISVGLITLVVIFQPEIRKFLLYIGNTTLKNQNRFIKKFFPKISEMVQAKSTEGNEEILEAILSLSQNKTGALIVLSPDGQIGLFPDSGTEINSNIKRELLISIFHKEGPLHDGAVIIAKDRIYSASAVMPVSQNRELDKRFGLRHRAAVGISELGNVVALVVSEETGEMSYAHEGGLKKIGSRPELKEIITRYYHLAE